MAQIPHYVRFSYTFQSGLGPYGQRRYLRDIRQQIELVDEHKRLVEPIGELRATLLMLEEATDAGFPLWDVWDAEAHLLEFGSYILDLETEEIHERVSQHYGLPVLRRNFCLIEHIEILPKFRGNLLGGKALKDFVQHFGNCGLFFLEPFPLQCKAQLAEAERTRLGLQAFAMSQAKATEKLIDYYARFDFAPIPGIPKLLFYNTALANAAMQAIDLEDDQIFPYYAH